MKARWLVRLLIRLMAYPYRLIVVPLVAFLPAPLAYGLACRRGDWRYKRDSALRETIMSNLTEILGEQLSQVDRARITRDYFRIRCCATVDVMRLAGKGRALARLVEIRGRENLEAALGEGKGAILCGAHFGTGFAGSALLGASGFPVTSVGRWPASFDSTMPSLSRLVWQRITERRVAQHWRRPLIQPHAGQRNTKAQMETILRANEVISMVIDPPPQPVDRPRAIAASLLGRQVLLLPGSVVVAQRTGASLLMFFLRRSADWRHQVLEISPPIPMDGDVATVFGRCISVVDAMVRQHPEHWIYWARTNDLVDLGLLAVGSQTVAPLPVSDISVLKEQVNVPG